MTEQTLAESETHLSMTANDRSFWEVFSDDEVMQARLEKIGAELVRTARTGGGKYYRIPANQIVLFGKEERWKESFEERHIHLGSPAPSGNTKGAEEGPSGFMAPVEDNNKLHNYDKEKRWTIETYDRYSEHFLDKIGAIQVKSHHDGRIYDVDAKQAIQYIAHLNHIIVEFPKRRKRQLSDEYREALRQRMAEINKDRFTDSK